MQDPTAESRHRHSRIQTMAWLLLVIAGLLEVGWAIGLKYTEGFTRPLPTVLTVTAMVLSVGLLGVAMKTLPVGTAYAVWVGVGAVGTAASWAWCCSARLASGGPARSASASSWPASWDSSWLPDSACGRMGLSSFEATIKTNLRGLQR